MEWFDIKSFYSFIRNKKYKVHKHGETLDIDLRKTPFKSQLVQLQIEESQDDIVINIYDNDKLHYKLWCCQYNYISVSDANNTFMFEVTISNGFCECILNTLLYLYEIKLYLLTCVAYLYDDKSKNKSTSQFGFISHRVNEYPPLDSYGKHIGYVLTILENKNNTRYVVVSTKIAKERLYRYIDTDYLCVKYTSNFSLNNKIVSYAVVNTENELIKLLKQLQK